MFDGMPYNVTLSGGSITVAAIPEPGSFALVGLVALVTLIASIAAWLHKRSANRSIATFAAKREPADPS
jgi:hypothetical protein